MLRREKHYGVVLVAGDSDGRPVVWMRMSVDGCSQVLNWEGLGLKIDPRVLCASCGARSV